MLGSLPYDENIPETMLENNNRSDLDENDYFLKGFLIGYRREKDRIKEWRVKKEENNKKEFDASSNGEWTRVISDMMEKEVRSQLEQMKLNCNEQKQESKIKIQRKS